MNAPFFRRRFEPVGGDADAIRVLVVDDSAVIRNVITRTLESEPGIRVVASAADGRLAVAALTRHLVDVVVLDIEMPNLDGLSAIPELLAISSAIRIVMASTLTHRGAEASFKALAAGAADYIAKPSSVREVVGEAAFHRDLIFKVRHLGAAARRAGSRQRTIDGAIEPPRRAAPAAPGQSPAAVPSARPPSAPRPPIVLRPAPIRGFRVLAIGSSTGGPNAVPAFLKTLPRTIRLPIFLTQHMPPTFTTIFAQQIERQTGWPTVEAADGMEVEAGRVHLAPGDFHMTVAAGKLAGRIVLNKEPPENFCRPSVDPMLRSLVQLYGGSVLAVILTGMGQDGLRGCDAVIAAGGSVLAQDEASSVVWGMPGAVAQAGLCSAVLPLDDLGGRAQQYLTRTGGGHAT